MAVPKTEVKTHAGKTSGFCDTCENFVESPSRGKDMSGNCMFYPTSTPVSMADMHWCRIGYKEGIQKSGRASSSNPEGKLPETKVTKDELTVEKPKMQELL